MRCTRRWALTAAGLATFGVGVWVAVQPDQLLELEVFDPPPSFCSSAGDDSFTVMLDGIAATPVGDELRAEKALAWAGFLRGTARREDTTAPAATELRALADAVERFDEGGDAASEAVQLAASLDRRVAATCG